MTTTATSPAPTGTQTPAQAAGNPSTTTPQPGFTSPAVQQTIAANPSTEPTFGFSLDGAKQVTDTHRRPIPAPAATTSHATTHFASNTVAGPASIVELARALNVASNGPQLMYEWVHNNVDWEPGWGVQKGALGALQDGLGNSFDQSLLLANLLRQAGFTANIVQGTIRLTEAQYTAWFGTLDIWSAQNYCFNLFIPVVTAPTWNGTTYYMDIKHVWVQWVSGANTYIFDPSMKAYTRTAARTDMATLLGYTPATFLSDAESGATIDGSGNFVQNMNRTNIRNDLKTYTSNLVTWIKANKPDAQVDDLLGGQTIIPASIPLLQTSLPYEMPGDVPTVWTGDVPAAFKPTIQVQFPNWNNPNVWDFTWSTTSDQLASTRLTLFYNSLVPSLYLNGTAVATGLAQPSGSWSSIYLTVTHPAYAASNYPLSSQQFYQTNFQWWQSFIYAGQSYLIGNAWGNLGRGQMDFHGTQLAANQAAGGSATSEPVLGEKLAITWYRLAGQAARICDLVNRIKSCRTVYSHQVGMIEYNNAGGTAFTGTDVGGVSGSSTNLNNDVTQTPINDTVIAMHGVALEAATLAQMTGNGPGTSTTTVIDSANRTAVITIGGTVTVGNTLTITVHDAALSGGVKSDSYTVITGDTLTSIATKLTTALNGDSSLSAIGVTAVSSGAVMLVKSLSANQTTYTSSTSGGATETITIAFEKIYLGTSANWTAGANISPILVANGYNSTDMANLYNWYLQYGETVMLGDHPGNTVGSFWSGWGYWAYPSSGAFGIINGAFKGGKDNGDPNKKDKSKDDPGKYFAEPIGMFDGSYALDTADLDVGSGEFPYSVSFGRFYKSTGQYSSNTLGRGWTHTHDVTATVSSNGFFALGEQYAVPASATIAELFVATDILSDATRPLAKVATVSLADAWWIDQMYNNSVIIAYPSENQIFIKQPDGSYSAPINFPNKLTLSGGLYTLTTPQGQKTNFNSAGQISTIVFPQGVTVTYTYTSGLLTGISNGLGRSLTLSYTSGVLTSVSDGNGRSVSYTVDSNPNLTQFTDANGKAYTYSYDQPGRLTKFYNPAFPTTAFTTNTYDSLSRLKTQSNARGQVFNLYFAGSRTTTIDPLGNTVVWYMNKFGKMTRQIDPLGYKTDYVYDGLNRQISATYPEGNQTLWSWDANTNPLTVTQVPKPGSGLSNVVDTFTYDPTWAKGKTYKDKRGNTTTNTYDPTFGNLLTVSRPAVNGQTPLITMKYNSRGQVLSRIDETGIQTQMTYDTSTEKMLSLVVNTNWTCTVGGTVTVGNVLTVTVHDAGLSGGLKSDSYTVVAGDTLAKIATGLANAINGDSSLAALGIVAYVNGAVLSLATSPGNTTTFTGSTSGGATETLTFVAGKNLTTSFGYDSVGNVNAVTDPNTNQVTFQFDVLRRKTQRTEPTPFSYLTKYGYDDNSNLTSLQRQATSTPTWQTYTWTYSASNKKLTLVDPAMNSSSWTYDGKDRLQTYTDNQSREWQYAYDANDRVNQVTDPTNTVCDTKTFTNNGKLASIKDVRNNTTQYTWDGFDRPNKTIYADSTFEQNSSYDANGNVLTHLTRSGNSVVNTYDVLNRLSTKTPTGQPVITNTYDLAGRLLQASKPVVSGDPSSGALVFSFDSAGRFYQEAYPDGKTVTHVLDSNGNRTKTTWPDGYFVSRTFDQMNRLTNIKLNGSSTNAVVFSYNQLSQRTQLTYSNGATVVYTPQLNEDITSIAHNFVGSAVTFTYGFNLVHEPNSVNVSDSTYMWHPAGAASTTYGTADNVNKYPTVGGNTYSYDGNKNLTGDGTWTYTFDTENQLLTASKTGTSASMVYDPVQRQSQKTVGSAKSRYIYSGWQRIADYDGVANTLQNRYVYGTKMDEPLITVSSGGTLTFLHADIVGSIVATSANTGAETNKNLYSTFGEITTLAGTTFGFTAQRYDSELSLYYFKRRYYSPALGRFLQPDPAGYAGPEDFNLYTYVGSSPLKFTDPLGLVTTTPGDPNDTTNIPARIVPWGEGTDPGDMEEVPRRVVITDGTQYGPNPWPDGTMFPTYDGSNGSRPNPDDILMPTIVDTGSTDANGNPDGRGKYWALPGGGTAPYTAAPAGAAPAGGAPAGY